MPALEVGHQEVEMMEVEVEEEHVEERQEEEHANESVMGEAERVLQEMIVIWVDVEEGLEEVGVRADDGIVD